MSLQRIKFSLEVNVIEGRTVKDTADFIEKSFNFFHASLEAKVNKDVEEVRAATSKLPQSVPDDLL